MGHNTAMCLLSYDGLSCCHKPKPYDVAKLFGFPDGWRGKDKAVLPQFAIVTDINTDRMG